MGVSLSFPTKLDPSRFPSHDDAGRSHATLYTLIASAQRHGLDPHAYLRSVLAKIAIMPMSEIDQFLPEKWKAEDAAHAVNGRESPTAAQQ